MFILKHLFRKKTAPTSFSDKNNLMFHPGFHIDRTLTQSLEKDLNLETTSYLSEKEHIYLLPYLNKTGAYIRERSLCALQLIFVEEPAMKDILEVIFDEIYPKRPAAPPSFYLEKIIARLELFWEKPVTAILAEEFEQRQMNALSNTIGIYTGNPRHQKQVLKTCSYDLINRAVYFSPKGIERLKKYLGRDDALKCMRHLQNTAERIAAMELSLKTKQLLVSRSQLLKTKKKSASSSPTKAILYQTLNDIAYQTAQEDILPKVKPSVREQIALNIESSFSYLRYKAFVKDCPLETESLILLDSFAHYMQLISHPDELSIKRAYENDQES